MALGIKGVFHVGGGAPLGPIAGDQEEGVGQIRQLRADLPHTFFLVPGYGAQGGTAADVRYAFDELGRGAIINASRSIMCAWKKTGNNGEDYKEAARAEAIRMRDDIVAAIK